MTKVLIILTVLFAMYFCYRTGKMEVYKEWSAWMQQLEKKLQEKEDSCGR